MKAYRWDFLFKLDLFLLIKYTYINKEQHTMENRKYKEKVDCLITSNKFIKYDLSKPLKVIMLFDLIIEWDKELMVLNAGYWPDWSNGYPDIDSGYHEEIAGHWDEIL